jgi:hypothetical protein
MRLSTKAKTQTMVLQMTEYITTSFGTYFGKLNSLIKFYSSLGKSSIKLSL